MSERVYTGSKSELEKLKEVLEYDPYLDPIIIPPSSSKEDNMPLDKLTDQQRKEREEKQKQLSESLKKLSESPKGRIIFARQEYNIKDGRTLGLTGDFYLYLSAPDDFLNGAEDRFKSEFGTIKRADSNEEKKVIDSIREEHENAAKGFGSIFG